MDAPKWDARTRSRASGPKPLSTVSSLSPSLACSSRLTLVFFSSDRCFSCCLRSVHGLFGGGRPPSSLQVLRPSRLSGAAKHEASRQSCMQFLRPSQLVCFPSCSRQDIGFLGAELGYYTACWRSVRLPSTSSCVRRASLAAYLAQS